MAAALTQQKITLDVSDGTQMDAYVSRPNSDKPHAAIIVFQEAFGVNGHIRDVADRFAREGYVAIAPELFHRTARGFEGDYNNFNSVMPHFNAITRAGSEADIKATFAWLQGQKFVNKENIYSAGYCMGGRMSFLANSVVQLRAAVSYYGGRIVPELLNAAQHLHGPMLFFWGEQDTHIPREQRLAIIEALQKYNKIFVNVEFSDAGHAFFCDERKSYQPRAARQSWALTLEFLKSW